MKNYLFENLKIDPEKMVFFKSRKITINLFLLLVLGFFSVEIIQVQINNNALESINYWQQIKPENNETYLTNCILNNGVCTLKESQVMNRTTNLSTNNIKTIHYRSLEIIEWSQS